MLKFFKVQREILCDYDWIFDIKKLDFIYLFIYSASDSSSSESQSGFCASGLGLDALFAVT